MTQYSKRKGYTTCWAIKLANRQRFKCCCYIHLATRRWGWGPEKSLSNLRTPKQRNCKTLHYKAKETHLIPQELQYVFQLGCPSPHMDMAQPRTRADTVSAPMPVGTQPARSNAPGTCWFNQRSFLHNRERPSGWGGRAKRRWLEGTGEKMSLIHFAYQSIYTFKKIVTYAFCKFSMLKD